MTDRELLEAAARAVGYQPYDDTEMFTDAAGDVVTFDPLNDDGDALRLAVKLKLEIFTGQGPFGNITTVCAPPEHDIESCGERHGDDPCAATRRAIVRVAAAIEENDD